MISCKQIISSTIVSLAMFVACSKKETTPSTPTNYANQLRGDSLVTRLNKLPPNAKVYFLKTDEKVDLTTGRILIVKTTTKETVHDLGPFKRTNASSNVVSGYNMSYSGSVIDNSVAASLGDPKTAPSWMAWAEWDYPGGTAVLIGGDWVYPYISMFSSKWQVPPLPSKDSGQNIYLFNCLQNASNTVIVQPILAYGLSVYNPYPALAKKWYLTSTIIVNGIYITAQPMVVQPGQYVTGTINVTSSGAYAYHYSCIFDNGSNSTEIQADNTEPLPNACITLEQYGVQSASQYPTTPNVVFLNNKFQIEHGTSTVTWKPQLNLYYAKLGEHADVFNLSSTSLAGNVTLWFRPE